MTDLIGDAVRGTPCGADFAGAVRFGVEVSALADPEIPKGAAAPAYPRTPDGRYFVVGGRLWRCTDPRLPEAARQRHVAELMDARRAVAAAKRAERAGDPRAGSSLARARGAVQAAKEALGERGPVWWTDGTPDQGGRHPRNTPYADWYAAIEAQARPPADGSRPEDDGVSGAAPSPR